MKNQNTIDATIFQDRNLFAVTPVAKAPVNSWARLTAGDDKAEACENVLRLSLVISLFGAMLICAFRVQPAEDASESVRLASPSLHLPAMIEQAPSAAVKAATSAF